jgi:hypothetical protein
MSTLEHDRKDILKIHRDWWVANEHGDIPLMVTCFPSGMSDLMFNVNKHPYFGIDEKVKLWQYYFDGGLALDSTPDVRIMKLDLSGDMAWIAAELEIVIVPAQDKELNLIEEEVAVPIPGKKIVEGSRATEIYKRDDGTGRPIWKMWHFHCSTLPDPDRPRPGFNDTARSRGGLGWNPWGAPLRVVGPGIG